MGDIGLGTMLGSNVIAIPIMVVTAYIATRHLKKENRDKGHEMHIKEHLLRVDRTAVTVLAIPYLVIIAVVAVLTVPAQWRGLQPMDGWIMLGMYLVFLTQALFRGKKEKEQVEWKKKEMGLAVAAKVPVIPVEILSRTMINTAMIVNMMPAFSKERRSTTGL